MALMAQMSFSDMTVGQQEGFDLVISASDLDRFIELSGDANPLHADSTFAQARGYRDRVVHGAYLSALVSRLVGMHLPGQNCIIHSTNLQFKTPLIVGSRVQVKGVVDQLSDAVQAVVLKITITDLADDRTVASGKVHFGFTTEVL
jgi:3-hydroxybutyryl-CoA dehydratase